MVTVNKKMYSYSEVYCGVGMLIECSIFTSDIMFFYFPALGNDIFLRAIQDDRMKCCACIVCCNFPEKRI